MRPLPLLLRICCVLVAFATANVHAASQFHLSLVGNSLHSKGDVDYMLDWVTSSDTTASQIVFGTSADALDKTVNGKLSGLVEESDSTSVACWSALLSNLTPGSTIYYAVDGDSSATPVSFTVPDGEITWAVFGDMGAPMQNGAAAVALPALKSALADDKAYSGVLNIGDLSYELEHANGQNYMEEFEEITSIVPMMTTVGNHEYQYAASPKFAVQNYYRRFAGITKGAGAASGSNSNEFYSFDSGRIHFAFINTEVYGDEAFIVLQSDGTTWAANETARAVVGTLQAEWLAYDLSRVDRSKTPYIVICGHRPPFKTPKSLDTAGNKFVTEIVPIMSKYQVDLYLAGHEHTYLVFEQSTYGEYTIPPIIISGSVGNNEYIREEADLKIEGFTWKTLIPKYGYGYLTATEKSLKWQWGSAATDSSHNPNPAMWSLEDEMTFARQTITTTSKPEGTPVSEPVDVAATWSSSGSSGSTTDDVQGTVVPANDTNTGFGSGATSGSADSSLSGAVADTSANGLCSLAIMMVAVAISGIM